MCLALVTPRYVGIRSLRIIFVWLIRFLVARLRFFGAGGTNPRGVSGSFLAGFARSSTLLFFAIRRNSIKNSQTTGGKRIQTAVI